jgi:hypothetical protein
MWVAGEGGFVIVYGNLAEGIPAHEMLWKLEVAVLHHLSIQAAVGTEVDILKKDAVHCRLYIGARLGRIYGQLARLCVSRYSESCR